MRQNIAAVLLSAGLFVPAVVAAQGGPAAAGAPSASPVNKEMDRAYKLKNQKKPAEAIAAFSAVLKKDPENVAALTELGYLHAGLKHYASAAKYLGEASAKDQGNLRLRMDLGYAFQAQKKNEEAAEQYKAVADQPGELQSQAQLQLGYLYVRMGKKDEAREAFSAAANSADAKIAAAAQAALQKLVP